MKNLRKKIGLAVTGVSLVGMLAGCGNPRSSEYDFDGEINGEGVRFQESSAGLFSGYAEYLTVIGKNGTVVRYVNDTRLEGDRGNLGYVVLNSRPEDTELGSEETETFQVAREQYTNYLGKILAYKEEKALEAITGGKQ